MKNEVKNEGDPWNTLRVAELAFGVNAKARGRVHESGGSYKKHGISTLEAERSLGSMHVAFGNSQFGEEGVEGYESPATHYDFVIPKAGLTVEMTRKDGSKERIISDGGFNF
jgi:leucyl aminopeptidase (aminopeptidase T)